MARNLSTRLAAIFSASVLANSTAMAQSTPETVLSGWSSHIGWVPWATGAIVPTIEWDALFAGKVDVSGGYGEINGVSDVRNFGCVADGITDQTSCFNNAQTLATGCVSIPPTTLGFYVAGTVTVTKCLQGTVFNPNGTGSVAGTSWIKCNNQSAHTCMVVNNSSLGAQIHDISLRGSGATPAAGSIAFQWQTGYNLVLDNFQTQNFDTCAYFGPTAAAGAGPISAHMTNTYFSQCQKHYVVDDGTPELYFIGGRWGQNGGADYNSADDFIYATKTTNSGAGGGPNTIVLDSLQVNPGGKTVGCMLRWGGFAYTSGAFGANKILNSHFEVLSGNNYTGSATQGIICIDSTVNSFPGLTVENTDLGEDLTKYLPVFNIDPAVPIDEDLKFINSTLCGASFTLTLHNMTGSHAVTFNDDYICTGASFAASDTTAVMTLANSTMGNYAVSGQWSHLSLHNNIGVLTDTATGGVHEGNDARRSWTPTISLGVTPVSAYTSSGTITRTPDGGYSASYIITVTTKGAGSGAVSIGGLPYTCGVADSAQPPSVAQNFTGLSGALSAQTSVSGTTAVLVQSGSAGATAITDANVTGTTAIQGTIACARAS